MNKSFLKWAGGKFDLLPTLVPLVQEHMGNGGLYIEPFLGGGAVALNLPVEVPKLLNDINPGVVACWDSLKSGDEFIEYVRGYFPESGFYNTEARFYKLREAFNFALCHGGGQLTAALFMYLNRHCFNGLCRFNKKGGFNVPYGRYKTVYFPDKELHHAAEVMKNSEISTLDFGDVMNMATQGDVVYCDPPYSPLSTTSAFTSYSVGGFSVDDHYRLCARAERLRDRGVSVLISNNDTLATRQLYGNADELIELQVAKRISCKANGRKKSGELIALYIP